LWPYIRKHVRTIRPLWCFFENVRGHTSMGLWRVLSDLEEDGYRTEWGLFSAEETGAPHQRIRCFILGRLGNPASLRPRGGSENCEGEQSEVLGTGLESDGELAHPASREPRQSQTRNGGQDIGGGSEEELGNPASEGLEGAARASVQGGNEGLARADGGSATTQFPARPGEEQYEWEEPRVTETQSELGGTVDGTRSGVDPIANRVDRLRLLGNGVVPQCAELAWRTLWKQLNDKHDD
jgi:DNA (cytosine-5)-methyltransferase 1